MDNRRRRADDFTDSLQSFHQTVGGEHSSTASKIYSEDSLETDPVKNIQKSCEKSIHNYSRNNESRSGSILAGNLAREQYVLPQDSCQIAEESCNIANSDIKQRPLRDTSNLIDETYLSIKPDLNKCINLFHNEYLRKEHDICREYSNVSSILPKVEGSENIDPRRSNKDKIVEIEYNFIPRVNPRALSASSLKYDQDVPKEKIRKSKSCTTLNGDSKRDTNHNIKANQIFIKREITTTTKVTNYEKAETLIPSLDTLLLSESSVPNKKDNSHFAERDQKCDSSSGNTKEELSPTELRNLLQSLGKQQGPSEKKTTPQEHLLRRLSVTFYSSPRNFTEKLLTIIEESVTNDSDVSAEFPDVSLCRLTEELRKMCKFIENETAPEWPSSPGMSTSTCAKEEHREPGSGSSRKSLDTPTNSRKSWHSVVTPIASRFSISSPKYRCMPRNISGTLATKSPMCDSNAQDSTIDFELLEAYCKKRYPDEHKATSMQERRLQPPLRNMNSILRACDDQMASLENSPNVYEQRSENTIVPSTFDSPNEVPEAQYVYKLLARARHDDNAAQSATPEPASSKNYEMIEPDDLESTLMYEIAKKRQRCLDTAKVMMEIDAAPESTVTERQTCSSLALSQTDSSANNDDTKLMETLMSCKGYQDYLRQHKPLLNLLQRTESYRLRSPCDKKYVRDAEADRAGVATLDTPKLHETGKKSTSPSPRCRSASKNAAVVTKPRLFVTPGKTPVSRIACKRKHTYFTDSNPSKQKGVNAKSIYRQIGLNYDSVISPVGMYIRGTDTHLMKNLRPKTNEMLLTPKKTTPSGAQKPEMKFKLSPTRPKVALGGTAAKDENATDKFTHPKVLYKLPSHTRTIKEAENKKVGNRVNELLRSTQDKVVIRHEGRAKTVQMNNLEQSEIHYDSTEESVHVEQTARKTCFSRVQKDY